MPKAKKDPNQPKRGKTAFMIFSIETRAKLVKSNPGLAFGEYGKLVGAEWKKISESDKKKYEKLAAKDKERYKKEMAAYEKKK